MSIVSLVTIDRNPGSNNVEYLYFQIYTHNTGIYNTMTDEVMDAEMSEWIWVVTMIVMTLITMVRYSRIFARHDNPSLYAFYMSILNDTNLPSPYAETFLHTSFGPYYIIMIINEINAVQMIMKYEI